MTVTLARSDKTSTGVIEVGVVEPAVILDVLLAVQRIDPTLGFRYSCRVAMCGTCAVRVDGRPVLACQTRVPQADKLVIEPLAGLPVVRDLIVDSTPFWALGDARNRGSLPVRTGNDLSSRRGTQIGR